MARPLSRSHKNGAVGMLHKRRTTQAPRSKLKMSVHVGMTKMSVRRKQMSKRQTRTAELLHPFDEESETHWMMIRKENLGEKGAAAGKHGQPGQLSKGLPWRNALWDPQWTSC